MEALWFENWESIEHIIIKSFVCFASLIVMLRLSGKRTLTKMNAFDLIMTLAIGSTLAAIITSDSLSISEGIAALASLIGLQYAVSWTEVRSNWFQRLIKSKPSILFKNNEFQTIIMREQRITQVEVLAAMRYSGVADPSQVDLVLMETDGQLSVILRENSHDNYGVLKKHDSLTPLSSDVS